MRDEFRDEIGVTYSATYAGELTRRFWALYIGSTVERDGQVPGFRSFWDRMTPHAQKEADRYCHWTWRKIQRDGRDPDECIASGVRALKEELRLYQARPDPPPPTALEVRALVKTVISAFDDRPPVRFTEAQVKDAHRQREELLALADDVPPPAEYPNQEVSP